MGNLPYIGDASSNSHTATYIGSPSIKPISPYDYEEYSATDHGGSVYFVGGADYSSQYLSLSGPSMPSGDFTLSTWAYLTHTVNDNKTLIDFNGNSDGFRIMYRSGTNGYHFRFYTAGGTVYLYDQSIAHSLNQWYYIVVVRDSGTFKLYVNNKLINTSTANPTFSGSNNVRVGQALGGSGTLEGYLSDIIYNPTTAITDFTPPTAPLSSSGTSLHIKGTDASVIDKSQGANLYLVGNTTGSTTQVKFASTKSMYFDGTGDYLTTGNNSNLNLGTGALTVELWYYLTNSQTHTLFELHDGYPNGGGASYDNNRAKMAITSTKILLNDGTANVGDYAETQVINQWRHWAWSRDASGNNRFYLNGTQIGTTVSSSNDLITPVVDLGRRAETNSTFMQGYIQDFRLTKGLARYTANFTPPTASLEG